MNIPPPPVTDLSYGQLFQLKKLALECEEAKRETLVEAVIEAQKSVYMLRNTITNLLSHWPTDVKSFNEGTSVSEEPADQP